MEGGEDLSGKGGSENVAVNLDSTVSEREVRDQSTIGTDSCTLEGAAGAAGSLFADILQTIDSIFPDMPVGNIDDIESMPTSNIVVDVIETIDSILNWNDKVDGKTNILREVEKGNGKEQMIADKDVSDVSALNDKQSDVHEGMEIDVEDQQGTKRSQTMNQTAKAKGLLVSIGSDENFDAYTIVEKGTQITEHGSHVPLCDGKEKHNEESGMRQNNEEQERISEEVGSLSPFIRSLSAQTPPLCDVNSPLPTCEFFFPLSKENMSQNLKSPNHDDERLERRWRRREAMNDSLKCNQVASATKTTVRICENTTVLIAESDHTIDDNTNEDCQILLGVHTSDSDEVDADYISLLAEYNPVIEIDNDEVDESYRLFLTTYDPVMEINTASSHSGGSNIDSDEVDTCYGSFLATYDPVV